ncbi:MAG: glycoside hydrolase family 65 protein [Deinococcus-Thermus bacterium]|jgi:alpha,alpha-trehalase|nr:glycoside hydrolase family 65 protein [Deinococcota bacterium]
MTDPAWSLTYDDYVPGAERLREALCTLGNGYFATRGAAQEFAADDVHYPGTYVTGGYNRLKTEVHGRAIENEDLVNIPNWLDLVFRIGDGDWVRPTEATIETFRQELDLQDGLLIRDVTIDQDGKRTRVVSRRLVSMRNMHLAAIETTIEPLNWSGRIEVRGALDGTVRNTGVARYASLANQHLEPVSHGPVGDDGVFLRVRTNQSLIGLAMAARMRAYDDGHELSPDRRIEDSPGWIAPYLALDVTAGRPVRIEKVVALYTSRDRAMNEPSLEACKTVERAGRFAELLATHRVAWIHLWRKFDIEIETTPEAPRDHTLLILRLHIFHMLQTTSLHTIDLDAGVPARGLHGEAYRGHIFWDELFIFPTINLRLPDITRSLLRYRYRRLDEARANARENGFDGAMFPWQSGSNGREESQKLHLNPKSGNWLPDNSSLQRHVNIAIAYNVVQYGQITGDTEFLHFAGAEMVLEIARFLASLTSHDPATGRHRILKVMGPDEYHDGYPDRDEPGLDDNAYTNVMTVWVLDRALEILGELPDERRHHLTESLDLGAEEIARWREICRTMTVPMTEDGIILQFEGYDRLKEFDWDAYRRKYDDIQRLDRILEAENDTPNRYKVSKQADVLMLFYLLTADELREIFDRLGYPFEHATIPNNIDYYVQRTSNGSTLSRVVHSWVLARSDRAASWQLFRQALRSDVDDIQGGTTEEGIHLGAMAGTVDLVQRAYSGFERRRDRLVFNPALPEDVACLKLRLRWRGVMLDVTIRPQEMAIRVPPSIAGPIMVEVGGGLYPLAAGEDNRIVY